LIEAACECGGLQKEDRERERQEGGVREREREEEGPEQAE